MTNFRFCFVAVVAVLMLAVPSISHAQTCYSNSVGQVVNAHVYSAPVVSNPVVSASWNSTPVVSSYPVSSPVYYAAAPVVSPATNNYRGYSYAPAPLYVSPGADYRVQRYYSRKPTERYDGQTLYVTGPLGFTTQRRSQWAQASYYSDQADRLERAYTGESRDQQEERRYRQANRAFVETTRQMYPNSPLKRLGRNMFLGPPMPSSMRND